MSLNVRTLTDRVVPQTKVVRKLHRESNDATAGRVDVQCGVDFDDSVSISLLSL